MNIKVKRQTIHTMDRLMETHPCYITIKGNHNHNRDTATGLRQLRVLPNTLDEFFKYFESGMTPAQAIKYHQEKLDLNLNCLANNGINPGPKSVYYHHDVWLKKKYGSVGGQGMFSAIRKYAAEHPNSTIVVEEKDEKFVAVLVTAFMARVHSQFREAGEVVFVDTTSHVDGLNTCVTPLLCVGPAGAAPLGIMFSSSQDESSYIAGFQLLKRVLGPTAFHHQGHPNYFITDNSEPERKALESVWPEAELLLCSFHVLLAIWRWLCQASHGIQKEDRPILMATGKQLLYASNEEKFEEVWTEFCQSPNASKYALYKSYLEKLILKKKEWSIAFRAGKVIRGNHTNNYAESTMCIIKEVILNRCKAYNTCQLIEHCNETFDTFLKLKFLDFALGRKKMGSPLKNDIPTSDVQELGEFTFLVKGQSNIGDVYRVDMTIGICECSAGQTGAVCKHQIACANAYMLHLPQYFIDSCENKRWLAGVAVGTENAPSLDFFAGLQEETIQLGDRGTHAPPVHDNASCSEDPVAQGSESELVDSNKENVPDFEIPLVDENMLGQTVIEVCGKYKDSESSNAFGIMMKRFKNIKSSSQLNALVSSFGSSAIRVGGGGRGRIPCQPTSISRREVGLPRGAAPIGKGRKRKNSFVGKVTNKRPRKLSINIKNNQPHAKTH